MRSERDTLFSQAMEELKHGRSVPRVHEYIFHSVGVEWESIGRHVVLREPGGNGWGGKVTGDVQLWEDVTRTI